MDNAHTAVTLLPCPFCGGEATINKRLRDGYRFAECESCAFGLCAERTEAEAITAWNTRATTADLQARLEASEASVAELVGALGLAIAYLSDVPHEPAVKITIACVNGRDYLATIRNADAQGGA